MTDRYQNVFNVLADEEKNQRKAIKKAQLEEDRLRKRQEREEHEAATLKDAKWADVSDSSDEDDECVDVSSDDSSDSEPTQVDIKITFGAPKATVSEVPAKKAVDEDDFLNSLATEAPSKSSPTSSKSKSKAGKKKGGAAKAKPIELNIDEDEDVKSGRTRISTLEVEVKKCKAADKPRKMAELQKARTDLQDIERRVRFKASSTQ